MALPASKATLFALTGVAATLLAMKLAPLHAPRIRGRQTRRGVVSCRVVVIGAGFGGLAAASRLAEAVGVGVAEFMPGE